MKSIYHHRQLFSFFRSNAFFYRAGMRAMRNASGMQRDHAAGHILTAHKITIYIIQYFITVDIAVVIGSRHRLRMIIEQPRTKRTYHEIIALKSLVYRWWLVHATGDGFKIMNAECKRITITVPPYYIKRVM